MKTNWALALAAIAIILASMPTEAAPKRTYKPYQTVKEKPLPVWVGVLYPTVPFVVGKVEEYYAAKAREQKRR